MGKQLAERLSGGMGVAGVGGRAWESQRDHPGIGCWRRLRLGRVQRAGTGTQLQRVGRQEEIASLIIEMQPALGWSMAVV